MFKHGFHPEWSTFKKLIWLVGSGIAGAASGIWKTVTGSLIHITDALASPMQKCEVTLEPIQDLHGQEAPYPAGGGKNKLPPNDSLTKTRTQNGLTCVANDDGTFTFSGTLSGGSFDQSFSLPQTYVIEEGDYLHLCNSATSSSFMMFLAFTDGYINKYFTSINSVVSLSEHVGKTIKNVRFYMADTYNGTVSPMIVKSSSAVPWTPFANICPITGWTGCEVDVDGANFILTNRTLGEPSNTTGTPVKRLFDFDTYVKGINQSNYYYPNNITDISVADNVLKFTSSNQNYGIGFPFKVKKGTKYYCTATHTCCDAFVAFYTEDGTYISNLRLFTSAGWKLPDNADFCLAVFMGTANTEATVQNLMLSPVNGATYEPYQGTTASVTFPDSAGTVYGGTVDLVSGVLTVDRAKIIFNGTQSIQVANWLPKDNTRAWIYNYNVTKHKYPSDSATVPNIICDSLPTKVYTQIQQDGVAISCYSGTTFGMVVRINDTTLTTNALINAYLSENPITVVYELAEPIVIQLTPQQINTLVGENNVWADAGDLEITYKAQAS